MASHTGNAPLSRRRSRPHAPPVGWLTRWIAGAVIAGVTAFLLKSRWNYLRLPELPVEREHAVDGLTVVIPARNEAHQIDRAVASLRPYAPVIVVDDNSTDETAAIAQQAGARVTTAPPFPPQALGKPNACYAGAAASRESKWLLFVDADTWFEPTFLPSLLAYAEREQLDVVTVFPKQECETLPERILLPYAFALYFCGVNAKAVNSPNKGEALANGQCLLFRRAAYESINGHRTVFDSVIEDIALAVVAKQAGLKLRVLRAEHLAHVRMYDSFPAILRGFQKNSFRFLLVNPISGLQVIFASVLLTSYLPVLATLLAERRILSASAFAVWPAVLLAPWYGNSIRRALWAPAAIYLFQGIALYGMASTLFGWRAIWKGRRV